MSTPTSNPSPSSGHGAPERPPVRRGARVFAVVVALVIVGLLLGGLYAFRNMRDQAIANFFAGNKPPPTPVAVAEVRTETVPRFMSAIGTLTAIRQVTVAPEVAGRVVEIAFESGASVAAGAKLIQLNDAIEQAELGALQAQAKLASINLDRARDLRSRQAGPQTNVDQYQAQLDEMNANIRKTQATIAQKLIRAPFGGDLGIRQVNVGDYVGPGNPIVTLTDLSRLFVNFSLPEQALPRLSIGQKVRVLTDAFPGRTFDAVITTVEPQVSTDTRAIKVQATVGNAEGLIRPGMFAHVEVVEPPKPGVLVVPDTAVDYTVYGDSVFVVHAKAGDGGKEALTVARVPVKTGPRHVGIVEILDGLKPGERVVVSGQLKLSEGAAVSIADKNVLVPPAKLPLN
ncbi:multidrug efflux system membrane fusion protein [Azospirillum fermentarium]|uniref:efflux RND transporter periplasmic adaptor subunit n=1 Tax=Azospirillum fermentarium TaxID=1233114 RepID=UPI0022275248|nr:efflux RND transporter periplasmic adaptor subunit [Azospirillum fermentarium]MCW2245985.1 multidrug efflux system membrane fusion protein [Azospirillum fermentarium]